MTYFVQAALPLKLQTIVNLEALLNDGSAFVVYTLLKVIHLHDVPLQTHEHKHSYDYTPLILKGKGEDCPTLL